MFPLLLPAAAALLIASRSEVNEMFCDEEAETLPAAEAEEEEEFAGMKAEDSS